MEARQCASAPGYRLNRAVYEPDLAMSLHNLSIALDEAEPHAEALTAIEGAVSLRRRLTAAEPAYEPDLATSLHNLAIGLVEVGRRAESLTAIQDAVRMRRRLARPTRRLRTRPRDVVRHPLDRPRRGRAARRGTGRRPAGRQRLPASGRGQPAAYGPAFAMSLLTLSIRLADAGRRAEDSLAVIQDAVTVRRRFARGQPRRLRARPRDVARQRSRTRSAAPAAALRAWPPSRRPSAFAAAWPPPTPRLRPRPRDVAGPALHRTRRGRSPRRRPDRHPVRRQRLPATGSARTRVYDPALATSHNNLSIDLADAGRYAYGLATSEGGRRLPTGGRRRPSPGAPPRDVAEQSLEPAHRERARGGGRASARGGEGARAWRMRPTRPWCATG